MNGLTRKLTARYPKDPQSGFGLQLDRDFPRDNCFSRLEFLGSYNCKIMEQMIEGYGRALTETEDDHFEAPRSHRAGDEARHTTIMETPRSGTN
jgi:hypothetical protein